jgi:DNA-binding XRE family transcriptional regulator
MDEIARFKTPSGDEMVVLPARDYARMVEAIEIAEEVAAFDAFERKLAAGDEEAIPSAVVDRILDGENRVHVWRERRAMTTKDLAKAVGITGAYLSQIETGKHEGTVDIYRKLAAALGLTIDELVG